MRKFYCPLLLAYGNKRIKLSLKILEGTCHLWFEFMFKRQVSLVHIWSAHGIFPGVYWYPPPKTKAVVHWRMPPDRNWGPCILAFISISGAPILQHVFRISYVSYRYHYKCPKLEIFRGKAPKTTFASLLNYFITVYKTCLFSKISKSKDTILDF